MDSDLDPSDLTDDFDLSNLCQEVKEYTLKELQQLQKMTQDVRDHWLKMTQEHELKEGLLNAIKMSIEQTEIDLKIILDEIESRSIKNDSSQSK